MIFILILIFVIFSSVHGFHFWKNASAKYKSVSLPTKDALQSKIYGDDLNDFDRRTDLTVSCRELDTAIELCCVKSLKTRRTQFYHRHSTTEQYETVNFFILSIIYSFNKRSDIKVISYNFVGNSASMTEFFRDKDIFII